MGDKVRRRRKTSAYQKEIRMFTALSVPGAVLIALGLFWKVNH
jgi:hypothetical protein